MISRSRSLHLFLKCETYTQPHTYLIGGVDEEGRQWQSLVLCVVQPKVPIALSKALHGNNALSGSVTGASVKDGEAEKGQIDKLDLFA